MGKDQRQLKNLLVRPRAQLRLAGGLAFAGGLAVSTMLLVVAFSFGRALDALPEVDVRAQLLLRELVVRNLLICAAISLAVAFFVFAYAIRLSHRFYGPMVPLLRLIDRFKKGDYEARGQLREDDEHQEVMASLNELGEFLNQRRPT